MALWDRPATARLLLHLIVGWRGDPTGFRLSIRMDAPGSSAAKLFGAFAEAYLVAAEEGRVRRAAIPEIFIPILGALTLRPATRGSLLVSQEPDRTEDEARGAWEREIEELVRRSLKR